MYYIIYSTYDNNIVHIIIQYYVFCIIYAAWDIYDMILIARKKSVFE